jgi:hypothetical protein
MFAWCTIISDDSDAGRSSRQGVAGGGLQAQFWGWGWFALQRVERVSLPLRHWLPAQAILPPPACRRPRLVGAALAFTGKSIAALFISHIAMPPKKPAGNAVQAEVALKQSLKNCLVNLPSSLVSVLVNANAVGAPGSCALHR